jgi:hypothetical protein
MIDCPLMGNWGYPNPMKQDVEGLDRHSEFACYKSHHVATQIANDKLGEYHRLIYVVRDPRDVAVSARHHFSVGRNHFLSRLIPKRTKQKRIIKAILHGDATINQWLSASWKDHVSGYKDSGVLIVKYETLLEDPMPVCRAILANIEVFQSDARIERAIKNQSFAARKQDFYEQRRHYEYEFLRCGRSGCWRQELDEAEKAAFIKVLRSELLFWSYSVS